MIFRSSLAAITLCAATALQAQTFDLAITNVTVIDVENGTALPDRTVIIDSGTIVSFEETDAAPDIADEVIDGSGKYLIPGLIDMHVHTDQSGLPLFLRYGVTTIRDLGTHFAPLEPEARGQISMRRDIAEGTLQGPEMFLALRILDGDIERNPRWAMHYASVKTPEQGRELVNAVAASGGDMIKVYTDLAPDVFSAIADEAKLRGLPLVGHVPGQVGYAAAMGAGLRTAEHLRGIFMDVSTEEDAWRNQFAAAVATGDPAASYNFIHANLLEMASTYDEAKAQSLFANMKESGVAMVPTLVVLDDPRWRYPGISPDPELISELSAIYQGIVKPYGEARGPFASVADAMAAYAAQEKLVGAMHAAGVDILAGTDASNPFAVPGVALHTELGNLVRAGLTPAEALRAATLVNARYLDADERIGSIEPGKEADLILLSANPLDDIANTQSIEAVFLNGERYAGPVEQLPA